MAGKLIDKRVVRGVSWAVLLIILIAGENAFADPPWRGEAGTTFQQWGFGTKDMGPMLPDDYNNVFGDPYLAVGLGNVWWADAEGRGGVWELWGEIDIVIPNQPESPPDSWKDIWIELIWKGAGNDDFKWDRPLVAIETEPLYERMEMVREDTYEPDQWISTLFKITVWPNPAREWIAIKGDIYVDQVIIDTRCVPEPATFAMVSFGALAAFRRRRKVQVQQTGEKKQIA
jgi:hypothetical protein